VAAIVIVGAMIVVSFGSYAMSLFVGQDAGRAWSNVFTSAVVLLTLGINLVGSRIVDRAPRRSSCSCSPSSRCSSWRRSPRWIGVLASVAPTFFAFLGSA